jgi:hypothetical protein
VTLGWASGVSCTCPAVLGNEAMVGFVNAWARRCTGTYSAFGLLQA